MVNAEYMTSSIHKNHLAKPSESVRPIFRAPSVTFTTLTVTDSAFSMSGAEMFGLAATEHIDISFDNVRGQPEEIRFGSGNNKWTGWKKFSKKMKVSLAKKPVKYQLKSRLGVQSREFDLSY